MKCVQNEINSSVEINTKKENRIKIERGVK
jgi:hypothetical protein